MTTDERQRLEKLFADYGPRIFNFCLRLSGNAADAEDLAAEVFLAAPASIARFRGEASELTLLYKVAINKHRMSQRSHVRLMRSLGNLRRTEHQDSHESSVVYEAVYAWALTRLGPKLREAFLLVKAEQLSYAEAAAILEVPRGTVQSRVHEACKRMGELLESPPSHSLAEATNEM
jgi:RNA polymerase sigma-70 factor (ECF subfamily)